MRQLPKKIFFAGVLLAACLSLRAQDIIINSFEASTYGAWTTTGTAFGSGSALGTLSGQNPVTGYQGSRLVNSFLGGDTSTGTLTSTVFTIQRNYIRFLIGGGNQRGKTCMNLIVNGQIVRSAVGLGDREDLGALQWNVSNLINSNATIQIVDTATGGWGHINVDQIVQTDTSLGSVVTLTNRYLCIPVKTGATRRLFELVVDGLVTHEFFVELADTVTPDFYSFLDLGDFQGKQALVRVDSVAATTTNLNSLVWSNGIVDSSTFYQEANRPIYHYTARRGWLNDPNGLVYFNGEYHMGYQHNPYGWTWANMHWGHAVSTDLVHWTELPEWLYPDPLGAEWSGSAVVNWNNSAGFGTNALVAFFTGAAKTSDGNLPRMSNPGEFKQCMAYSLDSGRTWTKYTNNPVVPNILGGDNRDPKVFWYAPGNKWVMAVWLINNDYGFLTSTNLKNWTQTSTFTFPNVIECPDIFELPLDGNAANLKSIFWGGNGNYRLGFFDGKTFEPETGPIQSNFGGNSYAGQSWSDIPAADGRWSDGRRLQITWMAGGQYPDMPFNQQMSFPVEVTLRSTPDGPRLHREPVREIELLHGARHAWGNLTLRPGENPLAGLSGDLFDLRAVIEPGSAEEVAFVLRGEPVVYNVARQEISCLRTQASSGHTAPLRLIDGRIQLRMLLDRTSLEVFGNHGEISMPTCFLPDQENLSLAVQATGGEAKIVELEVAEVRSAWD